MVCPFRVKKEKERLQESFVKRHQRAKIKKLPEQHLRLVTWHLIT